MADSINIKIKHVERGQVVQEVVKILSTQTYKDISEIVKHVGVNNASEDQDTTRIRIMIAGDVMYRTNNYMMYQYGNEGKWVMIENVNGVSIHTFRSSQEACKVLYELVPNRSVLPEVIDIYDMMVNDDLDVSVLK